MMTASPDAVAHQNIEQRQYNEAVTHMEDPHFAKSVNMDSWLLSAASNEKSDDR